MTDQQYADSADHAVAMAVRSVMVGISDLRSMAADNVWFAHVLDDADNLELAHAQLGRLLDSLHGVRRAAE